MHHLSFVLGIVFIVCGLKLCISICSNAGSVPTLEPRKRCRYQVQPLLTNWIINALCVTLICWESATMISVPGMIFFSSQ